MHKKPHSVSWFAVTLYVAGIVFLFARLRSSSLLSFYDDDAFYYLQVARNIVTHHHSTFDGTHPTNGYHPLWMLTLVLLGLFSSGKTFFFLLQGVALASFTITLLAARGACRCLSGNAVLTQVAAAIVALETLVLIRSGMEITLTIPLVLLLCWYRLHPRFRWTPGQAVGFGLLSALIVLSRLDSVLFIALFFLLDFVLERPATTTDRWSRIYAVLSCTLPLAFYVLFHRKWYHVWLPVSGEAKQMRVHHSIHLAALHAAFGPINFPYLFFVVYPTLLVVLLAAVSLLKLREPRLRRSTLALSISLLLFPLLQLVLFSALSDWPIWPWYLYSLPLATTGGFLLFFSRYRQLAHRKDAGVLLQGSVIALVFLLAVASMSDTPTTRWYLFGRDIEAFSQTHDGIYAMGDCAGTTAYLIHQPVVQLEGLVMDAPFLENIRDQRNLNQALSDYGVRYYITANAERVGQCYNTVEPIHAGPDSPHMHGSICQAPEATYIHGASTLYVFDLNPGIRAATSTP